MPLLVYGDSGHDLHNTCTLVAVGWNVFSTSRDARNNTARTIEHVSLYIRGCARSVSIMVSDCPGSGTVCFTLHGPQGIVESQYGYSCVAEY